MYLKFCLGVMCGFVFSLCGVVAFNYGVDSASIFRPADLKNAAKSIINGNNVAFIGNMDERIYQKYLIEQLDSMPECIALGSSKVMQFRTHNLLHIKHTDNIQGKFYNHGVSGANILDYYAILGLYLKYHNALPKCIVFGLDPWVFNINNGDMRYLSIKEGISIMKGAIDSENTNVSEALESSLLLKIKEVISFEQTKNNIKNIISNGYKFGDKKNFIVPDTENDYITRVADNSSYYPLKSRNPSTEEVEKKIVGFKNYNIGKFDRLDTDDFTNLMDYLRKNNIELIFYLPPYHPKLYAMLESEAIYHNVLKAQEFIKEYAAQRGILLYGDYNGAKLGLGFEDFLDGVHLKDGVMDRILR